MGEGEGRGEGGWVNLDTLISIRISIKVRLDPAPHIKRIYCDLKRGGCTLQVNMHQTAKIINTDQKKCQQNIPKLSVHFSTI
jgi:hypothetical protein